MSPRTSPAWLTPRRAAVAAAAVVALYLAAPGAAPSRRRLRQPSLPRRLARGRHRAPPAGSQSLPAGYLVAIAARQGRARRTGSASCCSASSRSPSRLPPRGAHRLDLQADAVRAHCCRRAHGAVRVRDQVHADPGHGDAVLRRLRCRRRRVHPIPSRGSVAWLVAGVAVTGVARAIRTAGVALGLAAAPFPPPRARRRRRRGGDRGDRGRGGRAVLPRHSRRQLARRAARARSGTSRTAPPLVGGGGCQRPDLVLAELGLRADHRRDGLRSSRWSAGRSVATPHARPCGRVRGGDDGDHPAVPDRAPALLPAGRSLPRRLLRARREAAAAAGGGLRSRLRRARAGGPRVLDVPSYTGDRFPSGTRVATSPPRTAPLWEAPVPATRTGWKSASRGPCVATTPTLLPSREHERTTGTARARAAGDREAERRRACAARVLPRERSARARVRDDPGVDVARRGLDGLRGRA